MYQTFVVHVFLQGEKIDAMRTFRTIEEYVGRRMLIELQLNLIIRKVGFGWNKLSH